MRLSNGNPPRCVQICCKRDHRENWGIDEKQTSIEEQPDELNCKMSQWQEANPHAPLTGLSLYPVAACSSTAVNNIQDGVKS
jgi:hypothetical protein